MAERALQRLHRRARRRQRLPRRHRRQRLLDLRHQHGRGDDLLAAPGSRSVPPRSRASARPRPLRPRSRRRAGRRSSRERRAARPRCCPPRPPARLARSAFSRACSRSSFSDDHRLAQRVALLVGRHLDALERHVPGSGDLDEERVGRGEPGVAGPRDRPRRRDRSSASPGSSFKLRQRQRRVERPRPDPSPRWTAAGSVPSVNVNCSPGPGHDRVAQLERLQRRDRRSPRAAIGIVVGGRRHAQVLRRRRDPHVGRAIGRHRQRHEPRRRRRRSRGSRSR